MLHRAIQIYKKYIVVPLKFNIHPAYKGTMPPTTRLHVQVQTPLEAGTRFLETLWFAYACRIVDKAIAVYEVSDEKAAELKQKFCRRGDYTVRPL